MSNRFNIVMKPKKTDDDIMDEDELDEEETKSSSDSDVLRKRMIRFMLIVVGIMILLLLILYIFSLSASKRTYTYSEVEKILKDAAVSYFKDHPEHLPMDEGSIVEIDSSNLVNDGKMKPLSEYLVDDSVCSGVVHVEMADTDYLYTPYLNCGEQYTTVELYRKILENETVITSGYGLYHVNNQYVYRGEIVNNYVELGGSIWRIVKINSNDNIVLISDGGTSFDQPWDNRYNEERKFEAGINNYGASRIREYLDKIYDNPDEKKGEVLLTSSAKTKLVSYNVCVGKRSPASESKDNTEECKEVLKNQKYGLLTLSDFLYASVDPNCKSANTKSCKNYNYLVKDFDWWLATANSESSSTVYKVARKGNATVENAADYASVRPVIMLNSQVLYKSGKGTEKSPYKIR